MVKSVIFFRCKAYKRFHVFIQVRIYFFIYVILLYELRLYFPKGEGFEVSTYLRFDTEKCTHFKYKTQCSVYLS